MFWLGTLFPIGIRYVLFLEQIQAFSFLGVPGVLMLLAFVTFLAGWRFYKITPASKGNILGKVMKCICYALRLKINRTVRLVLLIPFLNYSINLERRNMMMPFKAIGWTMLCPDTTNIWWPASNPCWPYWFSTSRLCFSGHSLTNRCCLKYCIC